MAKLRYKEDGEWKSMAPSQKEFDDLANQVALDKLDYVEQNLSEKMVIRELPDGVVNSFDYKNQKFIQRISDKISVDGGFGTSWSSTMIDLGDVYRFRTVVDLPNFKSQSELLIMHDGRQFTHGAYSGNYEHIYYDKSYAAFYLFLDKGAIDSQAGDTLHNKIRSYLNTYPAVLLYQLDVSEIIQLPVVMTANTKEIVRLSAEVDKLTNAIIQLGGTIV